MLYASGAQLEDRIVEVLTEGPSTIKSLHARLSLAENVSLRAVYKAADSLLESGVAVKAGKRVTLSQEWVEKVTGGLAALQAPFLAPGERAAYTFTSTSHLDAFWKTTVLPLENALPQKETFFYNPHNFWAYLPSRKESEDAYYARFSGFRYGFFTAGGETEADREFKRAYQNENLQIDLRYLPAFKRTDHLTLLGPFVITVRLGKGIAERIDQLYESGERMEVLVPSITKLCEKPGKIRFLVENNPKKAGKIRQVLSRNFYFRQS